MLLELRKLVNVAMQESVVQRNVSHLVRDHKANNVFVNAQDLQPENKSCNFCEHVLHSKDAAKTHIFYDCMYNRKNRKFVGEAKRKERINLAKKKISDKNNKEEMKIMAIVNKHLVKANGVKEEGRQE